MIHLAIILAIRSPEDTDMSKFIIGAIAVAIWLFGGIAQQLSKKKQSRDNEWNPPGGSSEPSVQPEVVFQTLPVEKSKKTRAQRLVKKVKETPSKPAVAVQAVEAPPTVRPMIERPSKNILPPLRPQTLRQQIILNEILQPPLSLRPHRP